MQTNGDIIIEAFTRADALLEVRHTEVNPVFVWRMNAPERVEEELLKLGFTIHPVCGQGKGEPA